MSNLNQYFDKIYCVNLDKRTDRWGECLNEFKKHNMTVDRFSAVDGSMETINRQTRLNDGEIGVILSNIKILEDAIKNEYESILILEDDIIFDDSLSDIKSYFDSLPDDWNMLYFGGNHNTHMGLQGPKIINEKVCKLHNTFAAHCVGIKKDMFQLLIDVLSKFNGQLDVEYAKLQKIFNIYSFYPAIAKQRPGYSDIQNKVVDYNWLIK